VTDAPFHLSAQSSDGDQLDLQAILRAAVERGASDVHLKVSQPPIVRFDGHLEPLEGWGPLGMPALKSVLGEVGASAPARVAAFPVFA